MMLTVRILGCEVLHVNTEHDPECDASNDDRGTLSIASEVYAAEADRYMGFTNRRGDE